MSRANASKSGMGMWPGAYWLKLLSSDTSLADIVSAAAAEGGGGGGGRELCDVALSILLYLWRGVARALPGEPKNNDSTVSITNTGCTSCDNRCRVHIDRVHF